MRGRHATHLTVRDLEGFLVDALDTQIPFRREPPKLNSKEVEILSIDDVKAVLAALGGDEIYPHIVILLSTGIRRGELMALQWGDVDIDKAKLCIRQS